ncbi:murein biosynthesis integral membrane protein MurJ [Natranaerobius thermophilus]|uniref:Probable lipid II flippase MurJ n=1 Tax=Natranaerobius thermophilus (strain ATCC BAA-1301 / DSM 18059 / JW/NM-WN-LF) TaxID=457570 RepID=B2A1P7_NATTJ|nr:murein biosynthesis integral membrane protein MurJ [Natranaerobius thermophilus]ACB86094.1 integral membrane protein MviN [Natranaerobius thermophilus JW/NM-WN-LF]
MDGNRTVIKSLSMISIIAMISKFFGLGREVAIASTFGASADADIFLIALMIPMSLFGIAFSVFARTIVPVKAKLYTNYGNREVRDFFVSIFTVVFGFAFLITLFVYFGAPWLTKILVPGFEEQYFNQTVKAIKIVSPGIIFFAISALLSGMLHSYNSFFYPAIKSIPFNLVIIIGLIFIGDRHGLEASVMIIVLALCFQFLVQLPGVKSILDINNINFSLHSGVKEAFLLAFPLILSVMSVELKIVIDRVFASTLAEGSISALNYAKRLRLLPIGIIATPIATVFFPRLSESIANKNMKSFSNYFTQAFNLAIFLLTPIMVGLIILRFEIVEVLFKRGAFDTQAVALTSSALLFYAPSIVSLGLKNLFERTFTSVNLTMKLSKISFVAITLNVFLNYVLISFMEHNGIALATTISNFIAVFLLFKTLQNNVSNITSNCKNIFKIVIMSSIMGVFVYVLNSIKEPLWGQWTVLDWFILLLLITIGGAIYTLLGYIFKCKEIEYFFRIVKDKLFSGG